MSEPCVGLCRRVGFRTMSPPRTMRGLTTRRGPKALANRCVADANLAGIPAAEIGEAIDDLPAFIGGAIEEASERDAHGKEFETDEEIEVLANPDGFENAAEDAAEDDDDKGRRAVRPFRITPACWFFACRPFRQCDNDTAESMSGRFFVLPAFLHRRWRRRGERGRVARQPKRFEARDLGRERVGADFVFRRPLVAVPGPRYFFGTDRWPAY